MRSRLHLALAVALLFPSIAAAAPTPPRPRYVEGEVIVKFKRSLGAAEMRTAARSGNPEATIVRRLVDPVAGTGDTRVALSRFPRSTSVETMIARLRTQPDVEYAEPNYVVSVGQPKLGTRATNRANITRRLGVDKEGHLVTREVRASDMRDQLATYPDDPGALDPTKGWGWLWVNGDIVWPDAKAAEVAVVDTGVDATHPELAGLVVNGYDFINGDAIANDDNGHGTHVAGIIAARSNNKTGIAGVSRAKIYAVKVLGADGFGTYFDVAQGIRKAADRPSVKVINVSLGGAASSITLQMAVDYAVNTKGKLLVAAAGNDNSTDAFYPAAYSVDYPERVLAVAASGRWVTGSLDTLDHFIEYCRADYSNHGDYVNITAPGTEIYSTQPWKKDFYNHRYGGADPDLTGYEYYSGTSMAAPHVAGVAARVFGNNLRFTSAQVGHRLLAQGYLVSTGPSTSIDVDEDGTDEIAECWEAGFTPATPVGVTPFLADLSAATALGRGRVTGRLMDATTGLGLNGATAQLLKGATIVGAGGMIETAGNSFFDILNVPWNDQGSGAVVTPPYKMRVTKTGYTSGVVEDYLASDPQKPGISLGFFDVEHALRQVSIPPLSANNVFVSDWGAWDQGTYGTLVQLDQYLFLPVQDTSPGDLGCTVGWDGGVGLPLVGDCGDAGPTGTLMAYPWARWMRDGGDAPDGLGTETTSIRKLLKTTPGNPVLAIGPNEYRLMLTDALGDGTGLQKDDPTLDGSPVIRLWKSGVVKATVRFETVDADPACIISGGASVCDWWNVGSLTSTGVFKVINTLGDAGAFPYTVTGATTGGGANGVSVTPRSRARAGSGGGGGGTVGGGVEIGPHR